MLGGEFSLVLRALVCAADLSPLQSALCEMAYYSSSSRVRRILNPDLVDPEGLEPSTSCMPCKRAPSCAMGPITNSFYIFIKQFIAHPMIEGAFGYFHTE